jgi:hypothetical protein
MNEIDDVVRTMLTDRASSVTESPALLHGIHRKIRRRRNRRRALVSATAVVALVAAGTLAWGVERDDRLVPADGPSAGRTSVPSASAGPGRALVPGNPSVPPAPLALGSLPPGFLAARLTFDTKNSWVYATTRTTAPYTGLLVRISRTPLGPTKGGPGTTRSIRIGGSPATSYTVTPEQMSLQRPHDATRYYLGAYAELTYRHPSGVWVQVVAGHDTQGRNDTPLDVSEAQLATVARGLTEAPVPVPDLLRFAVVPEGLVVGSVWDGFRGDTAEVQFVSPRAGQHTTTTKADTHLGGSDSTPLVVHAGSTDDSQIAVLNGLYPQRRTIRTGNTVITVGRSDNNNGITVFAAPFTGNTVVVVQVREWLELSDEAMARFLTGITPGKDFR